MVALPKIPTDKLPIPGKAGAPGPQMAAKSFTMLVDAWVDYKKVREQEITKREQIHAVRDVQLERIRAQKEVLQQYLEGTFSERRQVISGMFEALDKGIDSGDEKIIAMAMNSIVETVKTSPLQGFQQMMQQLDDPNVDAIEI